MQRRDLLKFSAMFLGAGISASLSQALVAGVKPGSLPNISIPATESKNISMLAEMIIPTTDTPGAIAAGVPEFIETIVTEWYHQDERDIFMQGLAAINTAAKAKEGVDYYNASEALRVELLTEQEEIASKYVPNLKGASLFSAGDDPLKPFFSKLKELVVVGYYTSEIGCKQEQIYKPMPGRYDGDLNYADFGRRFVS
jgi:hypothetical protein